MGKNKKKPQKNSKANPKEIAKVSKPSRDSGETEGVHMVDVSEGDSLSDDNPMYASYDDNFLINAILSKDQEEKTPKATEDFIFGKKEDDPDKVCPTCGMPLVGKSNYCMGCGRNVNPVAKDSSSTYDGAYIVGAGYGGGNAYVAREEALKKRRKKNKNISNETGLTGLLLKVFGVVLGFVIGIFVLRWYFAPKDISSTLYREVKVTKLANVRSIAAGVKTLSKDSNTNSAGGKKQNRQDAVDEPETPVVSAEQKHRNQHFYGTLHITAKGDRLLELEEEEIWDITGLDPNDVSYVINNINYQYEAYLNYIFIDYEIVREENKVTLYLRYRNLDIPGNVKNMVDLGVFGQEEMDGPAGKEYFSLRKAAAILTDEGWSEDMPKEMITPPPEEGTAALESVAK